MSDTFTSRDAETAERLIDAYGLNGLLEGLSGICLEKAEHIRSSYSDSVTAATWELASTNLLIAAEFAFRHALTIRKGGSAFNADNVAGYHPDQSAAERTRRGGSRS